MDPELKLGEGGKLHNYISLIFLLSLVVDHLKEAEFPPRF